MAAEYLDGFLPVPAALVVGNHDLEGAEFESDAANLAAWAQVWGGRRGAVSLEVRCVRSTCSAVYFQRAENVAEEQTLPEVQQQIGHGSTCKGYTGVGGGGRLP